MAHVVAAERAVRAAEHFGPLALRDQQQARRFETAGRDDEAVGDYAPAGAGDARDDGGFDRAILCNLEIDDGRAQSQVYLSRGRQFSRMRLVHLRNVARALDRLERKIVVGAVRAGNRRLEHGLATGRVAAGCFVIWRDVIEADRPACAPREGARLEVARIERHAAAAPEIGGAAETSRDGDAHVVVDRGIDDLGRGEVLRGTRALATGFEHERRAPLRGEFERERDAGRARADDAGFAPQVVERGGEVADHAGRASRARRAAIAGETSA